MLDNLLKEASLHIFKLDIEPSNYTEHKSEKIKSSSETNIVYIKNAKSLECIDSILFSPNVINAKVFIGEDVKGSISINIQQNESFIFIGDNCNLREVDIRTQALKSCILIGCGVTTTGPNTWLTGSYPGSEFSSIIIGDDCLFSNDITIRGSDGHPVMTFDLSRQINSPSAHIVIEPYVWIGQGVRILKSTRVGAASILGTSAVVTKDIPRFSKAYGVPAIHSKLEGIWIKDRRDVSISLAKRYLDKYKVCAS